jgi:hypothetical protein
MTSIYSPVKYRGDGVNTDFIIPWPYQASTDVTCKVDGTPTAITAFPTPSRARLGSAPVDGAVVVLSRAIESGDADNPQLTAGLAMGMRGLANARYGPGINNNNSAVAANTLYVAPLYIPVAGVYTKASIRVTTLAAGNCRMGIYVDALGGPGALLKDLGTVGTGTAGKMEVTFSQVILPGWYWMAAVFDATPTVNCPSGSMGVRDVSSATSASVLGYSRAFTYAALPADESAAVYAISAVVPLVCIGIL